VTRSVLLLAASVSLALLAWPPAGAWPAALVMLVPLVVLVECAGPGRSFLLAWGFLAALGLAVTRWLVFALAEEYAVPRAAAWAFSALLVGACALAPGAAAWAYRRLRPRCSDATAPLLFAALWTFGEWLRAGPVGVPWLLAAHALAPVPVAIQAADLGGAWAVGFALVAVNAGLGVALARRRLAPLALPGVLALAALLYGGVRLRAADPPGEALRVGVVQAAVPQRERFLPGSAERNTLRHAALTRSLAAREAVDLVVWSETAVDEDLEAAPRLAALLAALAREIGAPLVTGAPRARDGVRTNSVVLFAPGAPGPVESYDKQRLVPFSEYDPPLLAWLAPLLASVAAGEPYAPGREATVFRAAGLPFATPVCFEVTYPKLVRRFRAAGARWIVNLSNDAWFGRSGYARAHFDHAVLRAVELRTWVVRAANTGVSGAIDPAGRVVAELPVFEEGTFVVRVGRPGPPPFYARAGDAPVLAALGAVALACVARGRRDGS
jgi:apolipoprotein N-acyltransferase